MKIVNKPAKAAEPTPVPARVVISGAGFSSPTRLFAHFAMAGCEPSDIKMAQSVDGTWAGYGFVNPTFAALTC